MVNYRPPLIGVVGKTNVGKSTFFAAATEAEVEISNRPFTTLRPNNGIAYIRASCPHVEFGLPKCDPRTGFCKRGTRFIPVELMDVPGLIPGAHAGRGLGNKFMDELRKADAFLFVVDVSGSTSPEGQPAKPGTYDPVEEVRSILREIDLWFAQVISTNWERLAVTVDTMKKDPVDTLAERLSGIQVRRSHVIKALEETGLRDKKLSSWDRNDIARFASALRKASKPLLIVANKVDLLPYSSENLERLRKDLKDLPVVPTSAEAELALRKAVKTGVVEYTPGDESFQVVRPEKLNERQRMALRYIEENVFRPFGSTGVQQAIEKLVYEVLERVPVYPVEDVSSLTDKKGNVLPDTFLVEKGTKVREVSGLIHSEFPKRLVGAIDARTRTRISEESGVYPGLVVKFVIA